jgi:hypothetical protein
MWRGGLEEGCTRTRPPPPLAVGLRAQAALTVILPGFNDGRGARLAHVRACTAGYALPSATSCPGAVPMRPPPLAAALRRAAATWCGGSCGPRRAAFCCVRQISAALHPRSCAAARRALDSEAVCHSMTWHKIDAAGLTRCAAGGALAAALRCCSDLPLTRRPVMARKRRPREAFQPAAPA